MIRRLLLILLLAPGALWAQEELYARLAGEVCACMQEIKTERPRGFARACLHRITRENSLMVEELLGRPLGGDYRKDIEELVGHMTAYLAVDCPFLQTLTDAEVTEYRWSDSKAAAASTSRMIFPKEAASVAAQGALAEAPLLWALEGTVVAIDQGMLTIATGEGPETKLAVPKRLRSRISYQIGDEVRVFYRLDWKIRDNTVVKVLVE